MSFSRMVHACQTFLTLASVENKQRSAKCSVYHIIWLNSVPLHCVSKECKTRPRQDEIVPRKCPGYTHTSVIKEVLLYSHSTQQLHCTEKLNRLLKGSTRIMPGCKMTVVLCNIKIHTVLKIASYKFYIGA